MTDYKIKVKIISSATSRIYGDTLAGLIIYVFALKNKELFNYFYNQFKKGNPPFVFSSLIPADFVPFNLNFFIKKEEFLSKNDAKQLKKIKYLPMSFFDNFSLKNITKEKIDYLRSFFRINLIEKTVRFHNNFEEKELFFIENFYFPSSQNLVDIYLRIFDEKYNQEIISSLIEAVEFFLGKKKTSGYNNFKIKEINQIKLNNEGSYFVNLSTFNPSENDKKNYHPLFFDFKIKYPKTGQLICYKNPFKKKIILIEEGSIFKVKEKINFLGRIINEISYQKNEIIQIPLTIPFYFNYE